MLRPNVHVLAELDKVRVKRLERLKLFHQQLADEEHLKQTEHLSNQVGNLKVRLNEINKLVDAGNSPDRIQVLRPQPTIEVEEDTDAPVPLSAFLRKNTGTCERDTNLPGQMPAD